MIYKIIAAKSSKVTVLPLLSRFETKTRWIAGTRFEETRERVKGKTRDFTRLVQSKVTNPDGSSQTWKKEYFVGSKRVFRAVKIEIDKENNRTQYQWIYIKDLNKLELELKIVKKSNGDFEEQKWMYNPWRRKMEPAADFYSDHGRNGRVIHQRVGTENGKEANYDWAPNGNGDLILVGLEIRDIPVKKSVILPPLRVRA